ncbi:MAG: integral rane protein [Propionibacteriaceae bacterium]|nr:integral rane protein [Propionibacteriaceae bacterium]
MLRLMLILGLILFGMLVGAGAQLILGRSAKGIDWTLALAAGLVGSFVGGLLISLLSGDGLQLQPSGIIGSLIGALLVTAGWQWYRRRSKASHA